MDRGFNPTLAMSLFEAADITNSIINGQMTSEKSQAQSKTRMGFMGHLTLIAEEVVKFTERNPPELLSDLVVDRVMSQDWINYVEGALAETRERDNAILGGVRPEVALSNRSQMGGNLGGMGLPSIGLGGSQGGGSNALAEAGLNGGSNAVDMADHGSGSSLGPFSISSGLLSGSGFGSSSDEDEDEPDDNEEDVNTEVSAPFTLFQEAQRMPIIPPSNEMSYQHVTCASSFSPVFPMCVPAPCTGIMSRYYGGEASPGQTKVLLRYIVDNSFFFLFFHTSSIHPIYFLRFVTNVTIVSCLYRSAECIFLINGSAFHPSATSATAPIEYTTLTCSAAARCAAGYASEKHDGHLRTAC